MQRKALSADGMLGILRKSFDQIYDPRGKKAVISSTDALMTALSAFSFKFGSLHRFYEELESSNDQTLNVAISKLYKVKDVPSPTRIKEIIDPLHAEELMVGFKDIFRALQRGKALERYTFLDGHYLVAGDGTQYFESEKVHCPSCLMPVPVHGGHLNRNRQYATRRLINRGESPPREASPKHPGSSLAQREVTNDVKCRQRVRRAASIC